MSAINFDEKYYPGWADENKGPTIMGVSSAMTFLALLFVVARLYSRWISMNRLFVDDYVVIFCIILCITYVGLAGAAISHGGGRHLETLTPENAEKALFYIIISFVPGVSSFTIPKVAVVILLAKLLNPGKIHRMIMWVVSTLYLLVSLGMLVINFAQCSPAKRQWKPYIDGTCIDRKITVDYAMALGIISVFFDFYVAIYPTWVLCKLQLNWKKKLALSSSLGFGYCAGIITCYKCYTLSGLLEVVDFTFTVDDVVVWTNVEANCVLIGACIPTLYPLMRKVFGNSALGGSTGYAGGRSDKLGGSSGQKGSGLKGSNNGANNTVITIGSYSKKGRTRGKSGSHAMASHLDTINDLEGDSKYIILEERSFHASTTQLTQPDDSTARSQPQQQAVKHDRW
ncbi:hypothetical protein QBC35DRAFT_476775 [Podospora australis]|uniref:Rhodopsin domain-containing protein n=1 Tax=Podospora australis TaxID=1536484 RepID=A0AAN7AGI1_9PEZI|nr:hypothetical protein QBC35DRAFT_476775 [Podospora australis]